MRRHFRKYNVCRYPACNRCQTPIGSFDINYANNVCSKNGRVGTLEIYHGGWRLIERNDLPVAYSLPIEMASYPFASRYLPQPSVPLVIRTYLQSNNRTITVPVKC